MLREARFQRIYIACGYTDLRYSIDGLVAAVTERFKLDPFDQGSIFLFCGRRKDRIKALVWEGDGFLLLYKRLESGRFCWPTSSDEVRNLTQEQFDNLMRGFTIEPTIRKVAPPKYTF